MNPEDNTTPNQAQDAEAPMKPAETGTVPVQPTANTETTSSSTQPTTPATVQDSISPEPEQAEVNTQPATPANNGEVQPQAADETATTPPATEIGAGEPAVEDPGHTMSIVGLILAFLVAPAGLIVSILARSKSKKAGHKNSLALAGIIVSILSMVASIIIFAFIAVAANNIKQFCTENGRGTHTTDNGAVITCD